MNYEKIYRNLISERNLSQESQSGYAEKHHILPRCMGGGDEPENIIKLSPRDHFIAHRLLTKIYPEELGLYLAVFLMSSNPQQGGKITSSKEFQRIRELSIQRISETSLMNWEGDTERKRKLLDHNSSLWSNENFRTMMSSIMSEINTVRWESKEFRDKVTNSNKRTWSDKDKRNSHSSIMKEIWADQSRRDDLSSKSSINWNDHEYRVKTSKGLNDFFESNPNPWQRGKGIQNKIYWGLAGLFWDLRQNTTNPINPSKFSTIYDCGERKSIYYKMKDLFDNGWAPRKDPAWLLEFSYLNI